jgi:hypothetical protein
MTDPEILIRSHRQNICLPGKEIFSIPLIFPMKSIKYGIVILYEEVSIAQTVDFSNKGHI